VNFILSVFAYVAVGHIVPYAQQVDHNTKYSTVISQMLTRQWLSSVD